MNKSITKKQLWLRTVKRMNGKVHSSHILSVMNILIMEMQKELMLSKSIKITHFGTFLIKKMKERKHMNIVNKEQTKTLGKNKIRFVLDKRIKKILTNQ